MGVYIGFKENKKPEIFESETKPTKEKIGEREVSINKYVGRTEKIGE